MLVFKTRRSGNFNFLSLDGRGLKVRLKNQPSY
jgi:hypothetical protein